MYVLRNLCMCCGMHRLVFVMYLVALFWHSYDVFIGAHMETIEKFKKLGVLLELKGVKIIRSYRDLFQLIRDLFQLIYSGFSG